MRPPAIRPGGGTSCSRERPVILFPHPLSPTSPSVLPRGMLKLTPSTAVTSPSSVANWVRSSWISIRGGEPYGIGSSHSQRRGGTVRNPGRSLTRVVFAGREGVSCFGCGEDLVNGGRPHPP